MISSPGPTARRPKSAMVLVAALLALSLGLANPAAAAADDGAGAPPGKCFEEETYTVYEYSRVESPGTDAEVRHLYLFEKWGIERVHLFGSIYIDIPVVTASAWFPIPHDSWTAAFRATIDLYKAEGWIWNAFGGKRTETIPATEPVIETLWFETHPGGDWEATDAEPDVRTRDVEVACPCPDGTIGDSAPDCGEPCEWDSEIAASDPACFEPCEWDSEIAASDDDCVEPPPVVPTPVDPVDPTPPVDPTSPVDPTPDPDEPTVPEEPETPEAEVGGESTTNEDSDQLSGRAETAGVAPGTGQLPRTGGSAVLVVAASLFTTLGLALLTLRRRLS